MAKHDWRFYGALSAGVPIMGLALCSASALAGLLTMLVGFGVTGYFWGRAHGH